MSSIFKSIIFSWKLFKLTGKGLGVLHLGTLVRFDKDAKGQRGSSYQINKLRKHMFLPNCKSLELKACYFYDWNQSTTSKSVCHSLLSLLNG